MSGFDMTNELFLALKFLSSGAKALSGKQFFIGFFFNLKFYVETIVNVGNWALKSGLKWMEKT